MKLRIWKAKLNFYKYLQDLPTDTLAKEIFDEQKNNNFPGLVSECRIIAKDLNIESELTDEIIGKAQFKQIVKTAIVKKNEEILRDPISIKPNTKMGETSQEGGGRRLNLRAGKQDLGSAPNNVKPTQNLEKASGEECHQCSSSKLE